MSKTIRFVGDGKRHTTTIYENAQDKPEPYIATPSLKNAVNMALFLRRPLLLEGDPGCGKTRLAYAVAYELGYPLKECYIRSTSRARDLLYTYDALHRLYDVQMEVAQRKDADLALDNAQPVRRRQKNARDDFAPENYVKLGSLGEAIELSQNDIPSVVLIDEIDKAEFDFPNDLLQLIEQLRFQVEEAPSMVYDALQGKTLEERRDMLPVFIITSNREKELPKPFLRRCLYYYIEFPDEEALKDIVKSHFPQGITPLFLAGVKKFWQLRDADFSWRKPPSTSELLDWLRVLQMAEEQETLTAEQLEASPLADLPYIEALVKTESDRAALKSTDIPDMVDSSHAD
jgi:MoxR-like ATPase